MNRLSTGDTVLDNALDGGIPKQSSVLLTGGPGTGKTTVAMEFLQAGLEDGDQCVYVSTEQSVADLRTTFDTQSFSLDHPNFTLTTIHASNANSEEGSTDELVMQTLDDESSIDNQQSIPFNQEYIQRYFQHFTPVDRIVLDSASGLASLTSDHARFRQVVVDIIRQFKQDFEATAVLTAQDYAQQDKTGTNHGTIASSHVLEFTVDGVIQLWHDTWDGEYHRTLHITKMRKTDHDQRSFVMALDNSQMEVKPLNRSPPSSLVSSNHISTGLDSLDELLGGGFISGGSVGYLYDETVHADLFLTRLLVTLLESEYKVIFVPPPNLTYEPFNQYATQMGDSTIEDYLSDESLHILLPESKQTDFLPSEMFSPRVEAPGGEQFLDRLGQIPNRTDQPVVFLLSCQATTLQDDEERTREMVTQVTQYTRGSPHLALFSGIPGLLSDDTENLVLSATEQVLAHKRQPNGIETIRLNKGFGGEIGSSHIIEYHEEAPHITIS